MSVLAPGVYTRGLTSPGARTANTIEPLGVAMRRLTFAVVLILISAGCSSSGRSTGSSGRSSLTSSDASTTPAWHVVSLGDSIPFGDHFCGQCTTYTDLFAAWVKRTTEHRVAVENLSQDDGLTAARMAVELPQDTEQTEAIKSANIVLLSIGFNDTPWNATDDACDGDHGFFDGNPKASWTALVGPCLQTELRRYHANLDKILAEIERLRAGRRTAVLLATQYSDFGGPPGNICCPPIATMVAAQVKFAFNKVECEVAAAHHAKCVDLLRPFNGPKGTRWPGDLIGPDGTHPSAAGHRKIAELLEAAGVAPLA